MSTEQCVSKFSILHFFKTNSKQKGVKDDGKNGVSAAVQPSPQFKNARDRDHSRGSSRDSSREDGRKRVPAVPRNPRGHRFPSDRDRDRNRDRDDRDRHRDRDRDRERERERDRERGRDDRSDMRSDGRASRRGSKSNSSSQNSIWKSSFINLINHSKTKNIKRFNVIKPTHILSKFNIYKRSNS